MDDKVTPLIEEGPTKAFNQVVLALKCKLGTGKEGRSEEKAQREEGELKIDLEQLVADIIM
jgi:hypothetical protein